MSKLITHIKRLALTLCLATPIVSWAVTTTGYEDFGDTAGVVLWRGPGDTSGKPTFHNATVIDVAADGTLGTAYTMDANNGATSWQRFSDGTTAYSAPGKVLVYDEAGYGTSADAQFGNFVFGGLWVKTLAAESTPYSLVGAGYVRTTYFGADNYTTYFKVEKSYTVNRDKAATFRGTANVEISDDAVFTIHKGYSQTVSVPSGAKLVLTGGGTLAVSTLSVAGTLDISAETVPAIDGNVTLAGDATIVVPAGTTLNDTISLEVCSGTLSANGLVYVKVGDAEPQEAELTISGGTITEIATEIQTEQTFTSDYPSVVPFGFTYTYVATEAVTIPAVTVNGTLKTSGPITISNFAIASGADFEVVAGNTTVGNGGGTCQLKGNITVDAGATLTNTKTDTLDYNGSMTVDVYGTLAMGATRWSVPGGCTFKLRNGAQVTGAGDSHASLDFINGTSKGIDVYGSATVEGKIRVRANETRIWVNEGATLVLSSGIADGGDHHGGFKQVGPGTLELHANSTGLSGNASVMTQGTLRLVDTTLAFPVSLQGNSSYLEVVATEEATTVPVNVTSIANNNVTFSGAGKVNGSITKTSAPSGNLATALQSAAWTGTFVADWAGANDQRFDINSFGNANSVVKVTKLAGGYIHDKSTTYFNVIPTVDVSGTMTLNNGYSNYVTVFSKLTGSGTVTINTFPVTITTLDKFTGTFNSNANDAIEIGTINLAATPAPGAKIVSIGSSGRFYGLASTKVAVEGVVDDSFTGKLEKKSDGIYVAVPVTTVDITITPVTGATASVTADGQSVEIVDGKVTVDIGAEVSVTYTANDGYVVTGSPVEFTATAETTAVDTSKVTSDAIVAVITDTNSDTWSYTDIATAFAEVEDGDTLTLVGTAVTLATDVTVETSYTLAGDAQGTTVTGAGKIYLTGSAELTLDATVTVGNQFVFQSADAELTFPSDKTPASVRPLSNYTAGTRDNADGTKTYYMYRFLMLSVGGSNVNLAYADGTTINGETVESGTAVVAQQIYEGDTLVFTATPAEGYENVVVTVNTEPLAPVDGKYTVVVGTVNVAIQATATAMPVITVPSVEHATVTATIGGVTVALDDYGKAAVPAGSVVTVTYTADDGYTFGDGKTKYTIDTASATTFVLDESTVAAQYVASITVGENTTKYTSLQAAIDGVAQNKDIVLLANVAEGATVSREVTFNVVPGAYTYGDIIAGGDFILTVTTPAQGKTRYSFAQAVIAVTINEDRTLYTLMTANTGIEAANAGPLGTTIEVLSGDPATYVDYLPMFDLNTDTGVFTKVANPVAAVYQGVIQVQVYRTLAAAIEAATGTQTVKLLQAVTEKLVLEKAVTIDVGETTSFGAGIDIQVDGGYVIGDEMSFLGDTTWIVETISGAAPNRRVKYGYGARRTVKMDYLSGDGAVEVTIGDLVRRVPDDEATAMGGPIGAYFYVKDGADLSFTVTPYGDRLVSAATIKVGEADPVDLPAPVGNVYTAAVSGDSVVNVTFAMAQAQIGTTLYPTLAEAVTAAENGQTVKLLSNISVTSMQVVDKTMTLDLNGFAITEGTWTDAAITAKDDAILCVVHGGSLTVNDSSDGKTGAITAGGVKATSAIKMTKIGDTDDTNKAILVVNAGTLTGYYYAVSGNGSTGRGNTEVTINGGTLRGTCVDDSVAIFNPQAGTLTIAGGYLEGAMGVYVKSGTATVTVTAGTIKGVGTKTAYKASKNGFNNTGDAFVVDNVGYPGGAPAPSILGGTFVSENASAIASYSAFGNARITKFAAASLKTSGITEAVASSADVFDDYVDEVPVTPGDQTKPVETAEAAQAEAAKVVPSVPTAVAEALSDEQETAYKALFEPKVVEVKVGETTKYAVEVVMTQTAETAIKGEIAPTELTTGTGEEEKPLDVASLATATNDTEVNVTTKPGIYYGVKAGSSLNGLKVKSCDMATGTSSTVTFPKAASTDKAMFWVIFASPTPVQIEQE